jgi:hypothetical protein
MPDLVYSGWHVKKCCDDIKEWLDELEFLGDVWVERGKLYYYYEDDDEECYNDITECDCCGKTIVLYKVNEK